MSAQTEHRLKIALWAIPIIFSCGAFVAVTNATFTDTSSDVAEVRVDLKEHEALKAHPVSGAQIETILVEQRQLREEVKTQGLDIAAICTATSADCR